MAGETTTKLARPGVDLPECIGIDSLHMPAVVQTRA
jgi:hypothetical protein